MRLSTRARFGSRAMAVLASVYSDGKVVSVADLARSQRLSAKYLAQILTSLKTAGLVRVVQGKNGGYALARPPEEISLFDVVQALEGSLAVVDCLDRPGKCSMEAICPTKETWTKIMESMHNILQGTTLRDLAERRQRKMSAAGTTYQI